MNWEEYLKESARTDHPSFHRVSPQIAHALIGISSESGELLNTLKRSLFYGVALDSGNIREEVGDIMWYIAQLLRAYGWDLNEILDENIEKLKIRYPHQFTQTDAIERKDKI
jgi:NTP pyrophosphatase (non-canonical NTP hydrolase)